jgi:hypothetical protein
MNRCDESPLIASRKQISRMKHAPIKGDAIKGSEGLLFNHLDLLVNILSLRPHLNKWWLDF